MCDENILRLKKSQFRLTSQCKELENLYDYSRKWWEAWQRRPNLRLARWNKDEHNMTARYSLVQKKTTTKVSKDVEYLSQVKELVEKYFFENSREETKEVKNKTAIYKKGERRILRFSAPKGYGKGNFVLMLRDKNNRDNFFPTENNSKIAYVASFFADAYFSTEFNSVITAFGVFLFDTINDNKYSKNIKGTY